MSSSDYFNVHPGMMGYARLDVLSLRITQAFFMFMELVMRMMNR